MKTNNYWYLKIEMNDMMNLIMIMNLLMYSSVMDMSDNGL